MNDEAKLGLRVAAGCIGAYNLFGPTATYELQENVGRTQRSCHGRQKEFPLTELKTCGLHAYESRYDGVSKNALCPSARITTVTTIETYLS
jgi:hypothetical protein